MLSKTKLNQQDSFLLEHFKPNMILAIQQSTKPFGDISTFLLSAFTAGNSIATTLRRTVRPLPLLSPLLPLPPKPAAAKMARMSTAPHWKSPLARAFWLLREHALPENRLHRWPVLGQRVFSHSLAPADSDRRFTVKLRETYEPHMHLVTVRCEWYCVVSPRTMSAVASISSVLEAGSSRKYYLLNIFHICQFKIGL